MGNSSKKENHCSASKADLSLSTNLFEAMGVDCHSFLSSISDFVFVVDQDLTVKIINRTLEGHSIEDVEGMHMCDFLPEDDRDRVYKIIKNVFKTGVHASYESPALNPDGSQSWYTCIVGPIKVNEEVVAATVLARDITSKKIYEEQLKRKLRGKKKVGDLEPASLDRVFRLNREGVFLDCSIPDGATTIVPPEVFLGKKITTVLPEHISKQTVRKMKDVFATKSQQSFEYKLHEDGVLKNFEARLVPISDEECIIIVRDLTDIRQLQEDVLELGIQEQRRIGHDLHDGLSQHLTGIAFLGKGLENKLITRDMPEAKDASEIVRLVNQAIDRARHLAQDLHLVELERSGFQAACEELAINTEKIYKIGCRVKFDSDLEIQDISKAVHLYRIVQEAVNNAVRHSDADQILIELKHYRYRVEISVIDNGKGFDASNTTHRGAGLKIMDYRAGVVGGVLHFVKNKTGGTKVLLNIYPESSGL